MARHMTAAVKLGLQSSWRSELVAGGGVHWGYGMVHVVGFSGMQGCWLGG